MFASFSHSSLNYKFIVGIHILEWSPVEKNVLNRLLLPFGPLRRSAALQENEQSDRAIG